MNVNQETLDPIVLHQTPNSRMYWYDSEQTILINEVTGRWNWDEAYDTISTLNGTVRQSDHSVYTIHWFRSAAYTSPQGMALRNLSKLIQDDPPNERLVFFVGTNGIFQGLVNTVIRAYKFTGLTSKYYFPKTLDDALRIIAKDRQPTV